jgi:hypothetical protein
MRLLKVVIISLLLFGCEQTEEEKAKEQADKAKERAEERAKQVASDTDWLQKNVFYYKDKRTNLCFASWDPGRNWGLFTNVPCSPEVESVVHTFTSDK